MYQDRVITHLQCVEVPINQVSNLCKSVLEYKHSRKVDFYKVFKLVACLVHKMTPLTATEFVEACPIKQEVLIVGLCKGDSSLRN